jgi:hypothetical protein
MTALAETLLQAKAYHRSGQLEPARQLYGQNLQVDQTIPEVHYLFGLLLHALGRLEESAARETAS